MDVFLGKKTAIFQSVLMKVTCHKIIVAEEREFLTIGDPERSRMHVTHNNANIDIYGEHRRDEQHEENTGSPLLPQ